MEMEKKLYFCPTTIHTLIMDNFDGSRLALSVKEGNKSAFDRFVLKYHAVVLHFISSITKDEEASKDITQNVFLKLWINRNSIDESKPLKSFLFTIAKNDTISYLRKNIRLGGIEQCRDMADTGIMTESKVELKDLRNAISRTVSTLPEQRKKVFVMHDYDELTCKEIGDRLGLSERTVEKHLELARKDIRKEIN